MTEHESKAESLPWTGERYVPEVGGQIALEHLHRYALACELAADRTVLDIACGEGYGSAMLAERARSVVGVDLSHEVVTHAARRYPRANLRFAAGRCDSIPLATASVDLVVCFETIEHVGQHERVLAEFKRVLRPEGTLVLSSPEKSEYSDARQQVNPFHVKELYADEFRQLVASQFRHIAVGGQRVAFGSAILMEGDGGPLVGYQWDGSASVRATGVARPHYLIAVASDVVLPPIGGSIFEQPINDSDIVQGWARAVADRDDRMAALTLTLAEREQAAASVVAEQKRSAAAHEHQVAELADRIAAQEAEIAERKRALREHADRAAALEAAVVARDRSVER